MYEWCPGHFEKLSEITLHWKISKHNYNQFTSEIFILRYFQDKTILFFPHEGDLLQAIFKDIHKYKW